MPATLEYRLPPLPRREPVRLPVADSKLNHREESRPKPAAAALVASRLDHVGDVLETTLLTRVDRWVASLECLAQDPLLGISFAATAEETDERRGPHNSSIYPYLNTGICTEWTLWTGFVVGSPSR